MQASQDLFDLLVSKDFTVKTLDNKGKPVVDPSEAEMFSFDFEVGNNNYGTVVVLITDNTAMEVYYGDNVGKNVISGDLNSYLIQSINGESIMDPDTGERIIQQMPPTKLMKEEYIDLFERWILNGMPETAADAEALTSAGEE